MGVLLYVAVPVLVVAVVSTFMWLRNRQPTSLEHGVDAFRREMEALSPDAMHTRVRRGDDPSAERPPRRPPGRD